MAEEQDKLVKLRNDLLDVIPSSEHRVDLSFHLRCFYGSDAVSSLLNNDLARTRDEATMLCQNLLDDGLMRPVHEQDPTFQALVLYYFVGRRDLNLKRVNMERRHSGGDIFLQDYLQLYDETKEQPPSPMNESIDNKRTRSLDCSYDENKPVLDDSMLDSEEEESKSPGTPPVIRDFDGTVLNTSIDDISFCCDSGIRLMVISMIDPPSSLRGFRESHYYIEVSLTNKHTDEREIHRTRPVVKQNQNLVTWMEFINLGYHVDKSTSMDIRLMIYHRRVPDEELGRTTITVGELASRPTRDLVLSNVETDEVVARSSDSEFLTQLRVGVEPSSIPSSWPSPTIRRTGSYAKHLFVITRGTRGDVQPFVALARALANNYNWMITICTELRYKKFIKEHSRDLKQGCIRFRISGGDTQKRVEGSLAKWAIHLNSATMQHVMLGNSEMEFFDSEPAIFHWAKKMKPDYIMFGFTMAHIAMICSEALGIPLMGLVLQPTCIPSQQYPPLHIGNQSKRLRHCLAIVGQKISNHFRHTTFASLKVLLENNPIFGGKLNAIRRRRGLLPISLFPQTYMFDAFQSNAWMHLQHKKIPLIVPINQYAFGGKPGDWGPNSIFTNYIFLRGDTVPPLPEHFVRFIHHARQRNAKLVSLAFSSMPIERKDILHIAANIIRNCEKEVCIIALTGDRTPSEDDELEAEIFNLQKEGRLLLDSKGAPYGRLFPLMDVNVVHGGLGTCGEAIMAGVPVIVCGVLLFDQRFWGRRCHDMGIGPFPVHISKFNDHCVPLVDQALADDSPWKKNAQIAGKRILETMLGDPTGVQVNARTVFNMAKSAPVFQYDGSKADYQFYHKQRSLRKLYASTNMNRELQKHAENQQQRNIIVRSVEYSIDYCWKVIHWSVFFAAAGKSYILTKYSRY